MKRFLVLAILCTFSIPAFAINDTDDAIKKAEIKYQRKIEKIKRKQQIKCIKHPEYCNTSALKETNLTLGTAQKSVKIGATQDEVTLALGAPNIVTTDSNGKETWIYDKVSSVSSYNNNGFDIGLILVNYAKNGGNAQTSQKTLTIIIKFSNKKVESFKYHMSSF